MHGQDVWSKGTGVTSFKGSNRYDKVDPAGETKSIHAIVGATTYTAASDGIRRRI
jgi:hypothetical protein